MSVVNIHDKQFKPYMPAAEIDAAISEIAERMQTDLAGKKPLFLGILNGAFLFMADLLRKLDMDCEVAFLRLASYEGTSSTGKVKQLLGLGQNIEGRTVVVVEDIVDTGLTLEAIFEQLEARDPAEIKVATLLYKPEAYQKDRKLDYVVREIPNKFVVGYGLDYDGLGRNLPDIYQLAE